MLQSTSIQQIQQGLKLILKKLETQHFLNLIPGNILNKFIYHKDSDLHVGIERAGSLLTKVSELLRVPLYY